MVRLADSPKHLAHLEDKQRQAEGAIKRHFDELVLKGELVVFVVEADPEVPPKRVPTHFWSEFIYEIGQDKVRARGRGPSTAWVMEVDTSGDSDPEATGEVPPALTAQDDGQVPALSQSVHLVFDDENKRVMVLGGQFIDGRSYDVLAALATIAALDDRAKLDTSQRRVMTRAELAGHLSEATGGEIDLDSATTEVARCRKKINSVWSLDPKKVIETPKRGYRLHPSVSFTRGSITVLASAARLAPGGC